jgi:prepilin-type N-terminal cleavage/methylation domain-containing protein
MVGHRVAWNLREQMRPSLQSRRVFQSKSSPGIFTIQKLQSTRRGFTLVELMVVVGIIALLTLIAVPNWLRARKRTQATRILEDLRVLDHAVDQYAIDTAKAGGANPAFSDLRNYVKVGSVLYSTGADLFGNTYGPFTVDSVVQVPAGAYSSLSDVAPPSFWSPYNQVSLP